MSEANSLPHMTNIKELVETGPIAEGRARRSGGRAGRLQKRTAPPASLPVLERAIAPVELLSPSAVERLHAEACRILEESGILFRDAEALSLWQAAGAVVEGECVRAPRRLVEKLIGLIPAQFTLHSRNAERHVPMGGAHVAFAPMERARHVLREPATRQAATLADLEALHKLTQLLPEFTLASALACEPTEIAVGARHVAGLKSLFLHCDKPFLAPAQSAAEADDTIAMARLVFGQNLPPVMLAIVQSRQPRIWDGAALAVIRSYARANQPCVIMPKAPAGAASPASVAGSLAFLHAQALAGLAFTQLVAPGSPQLYGQHAVAVNMRSGAPMGATPEALQMMLAFGQLARHCKLAFALNGALSGAKRTDAQAGAEAAQCLMAAIQSGAHLITGAGWLEAGETIGLGKFMLDADAIGSIRRFAEGVRLDDLDAAMATVREVPPGAHFLGTAHTLAHFEKAFHNPALMDFSVVEQWEAEGERNADQRGAEQAGWSLEGYAAPALAQSAREAIAAYKA